MKIIELKNKLGELIIPKKWEPVGTIKIFDREQDMSKMYYGTWELTLKERSPIGINPSSTEDRFKTAGQQFGEKTHKLTVEEMPAHKHSGINVADNYLTAWNTKSGTTAIISLESLAGGGGTANQNLFETKNSGGGQPHNNIHPVETVYFYKRVA